MQGYEKLDDVLARAFKQASEGKGAERHANDLPFHEQPMQKITDLVGRGFIHGQAIKKIVESQGMEPSRAVNELLGAINYIAGAIIHIEAQNDNEPVYAEFLKQLDNGSYLLQSLPEHAGDDPASGLIKVPEGADAATLCGGHPIFWKGNEWSFDPKVDTEFVYYSNDSMTLDHYLDYWKSRDPEIIWQRELDRDQAREVLAKMKRGETVEINKVKVTFDESGVFHARIKGYLSEATTSLNQILNYLENGN